MNLQSINLLYWGRIHEMCQGTKIMPWECVRYSPQPQGFFDHPNFQILDLYPLWSFAFALVDDNPVFPGDTIYDKKTGEAFRVLPLDEDTVTLEAKGRYLGTIFNRTSEWKSLAKNYTTVSILDKHPQIYNFPLALPTPTRHRTTHILVLHFQDSMTFNFASHEKAQECFEKLCAYLQELRKKGQEAGDV